MAQQMLSTKYVMNAIDDCLKDSDTERDGTVPDYGNMSLQELRDSLDLDELLETNLVIDIPDPNPKTSDTLLHTPTAQDPTPLATGANAAPITLKIKVPRSPTRPTDPRRQPQTLPPSLNIAELEVRLICQQPLGARPDNIYLGYIRHSYAPKAIRGCHLYNSILKDTREFLTNISPFSQINHYMRMEIRQPKFTYISETGSPITVSGSGIPRPYSERLPEPLYTGCPISVLTLYFSIDVTPRAPRKASRKRSSPDSGHDEQQQQQGQRQPRSALPPPKHKKYLYEI
jgi:hypothetical protein